MRLHSQRLREKRIGVVVKCGGKLFLLNAVLIRINIIIMLDIDLLDWYDSLSLDTLAQTSMAARKHKMFTTHELPLPSALSSKNIYGNHFKRRPNDEAVSIDSALLTADRRSFGALGFAFIAYALSEQCEPFNLQLTPFTDGLNSLIINPSSKAKPSALDKALGIRQKICSVRYKPQLPKDNPNYSTTEQDDPTYPREHLPYCCLDYDNESRTNGGKCNSLYFKGSSPSLVWMGTFLLNLSLEDNNSGMALLQNYYNAHSLCEGSAELRLTIANTGKPEFSPSGH